MLQIINNYYTQSKPNKNLHEKIFKVKKIVIPFFRKINSDLEICKVIFKKLHCILFKGCTLKCL